MTDEPQHEARSHRDAVFERLEDQIGWYDRKSIGCQQSYKRVMIAQLILGGAVPVIALTDSPAVVTASIGALVVILEGLQQLNQWQANWVLYRSTTEALKHERYLYLAKAGPYRDGKPPRRSRRTSRKSGISGTRQVDGRA